MGTQFTSSVPFQLVFLMLGTDNKVSEIVYDETKLCHHVEWSDLECSGKKGTSQTSRFHSKN